ncbi:Hypothetical protein (Fragment) [Durusdinium trenchii]|uniref:Uncharacterized protein n=1 Tax=Durusdinium trenchii TaxID=1381693 RepID=A0ABP0LMV4_9DINO
MAMAVAFLLPPRPAGALSPPPASARPAQKHRAVGSRQGCVALAACGVGLALAAGQRCSGNSRGPAVRPWQLQAKAKKDDPKSHDGLVALGGILQAATDAYKASVQEQVDSEKRLRAEMEEKVEKLHADACQAFAQEQVDSEKRLEEKIEKLLAEVETLKASLQSTTLPGLSLEDIEGVWFDEASKNSVLVVENGT